MRDLFQRSGKQKDDKSGGILKLDKQVQVVRNKHAGNKLKNKHLEQQFKELESKFESILKD